jgi:hypothetical protein
MGYLALSFYFLSLFVTSLSISMVAFIFISSVECRYAVIYQEFGECLSVYPMMASRESKCRQLSSFNPPQYRGVAYPAAPCHKTYSHKFRIPMLNSILQISLLIAYQLS